MCSGAFLLGAAGLLDGRRVVTHWSRCDELAARFPLGWIRRVDATTRWTTSVCTGSLLLGAAGLLKGLEATTHWSAVADLGSYGAVHTPRRVVEQGRIITSAGVSSGIDMALRLAELAAGRVAAEAYQLLIEYDPQPPFDSGSLAKASQEVRDFVAAR